MRTIAIAILLAATAATLGAQPVGTAFTYQGRLTDAGNPANGAYDMQLALFDAASGGAQVGPTVTRDDVVVANGLFTVSLDFGGVFAGSKRWLELAVRPGASTGAYTPLAGRQELTASPNAVFSASSPWTGIAGKPAGFADDVDNDALGALTCPDGQIAKRVAGAWACADDTDSGGDITAVTAGTGLTGGGTSGAVSLGVNLAGNGSASTVARSDHDHFSQSWSGSTATGLTITNSGGASVRGLSTATAPGTMAIYGEYSGTQGYGIYGNATSTAPGTVPMGVLGASVHGFGVFGISQDGIGLSGTSSATSGFTVGAGGTSQSPDGVGVYGQAVATNGFAIGVRGDTFSPAGIAVWGYSTSTASTGFPIGVEGRSDSPIGIGVNGFAAATTGANFGVRGGSNSSAGTGVIGVVSPTTGFTRGVYGESASSGGVGVYGLNTAENGTGLQGASAPTTGFGVGVRAVTNAPSGSALFAQAQGSSGQNYGVWGQTTSISGTGVFGLSGNTGGAATGVWGRTYSSDGNGVIGQAMSTLGQAWGVLGTSPSTAGIGVFGVSTPTSAASTGVGVWGRGNATSGYGGYFENLSGGPALGVSAGGIRFSDGTTQTTAAIGGGGDITAVTAGSGLSGGGTSGAVTLSVDTATTQARIGGTCAPGESIRIVNQNGTVTCEVDNDSGGDITGVTAGSGLTGGATSGDATLAVNFAGSGSSTFASRLDHHHMGQVWSGGFGSGQVFAVVNTGTGGFTDGLWGQSDAGTNARGVVGYVTGGVGQNYGVWGQSDSTAGRAVFGIASAGSGTTSGVHGESASTNGRGVFGSATGATGTTYGVYGQTASPIGLAVYGQAAATSGVNYGVMGETSSPAGYGVFGLSNTATGAQTYGVFGQSMNVADGRGVGGRGVYGIWGIGTTAGVYGIDQNAGASSVGLWGQSVSTTSGAGVFAQALGTSGGAFGIYAQSMSTAGYAGFFVGRAHVTGTLSKGAGSFKIDHPLDPENKYLYHSFVESPDMMNIYNGNVTTDDAGFATVQLPDWFQALNRDFRYQLTVIGRFAQAIVAKEVEDNRFTIQTSVPGVKVSWQVTGIRHDAFAEKHRIPVEEDKSPDERGTYLHPEEHGRSLDQGLDRRIGPLQGQRQRADGNGAAGSGEGR